jgi:hypothetical protein
MADNPVPQSEEIGPKQRTPFAKWAARISPAAPLLAWAFTALYPAPQSRAGKLAAGGVGILTVVVGFILALVALRGVRKHGKEGIRRPAIVGLVVNGTLIAVSLVGMAVLLPALKKVARLQNAGYTRTEMEAMPEVIAGSHKIFDETLGFRLEIPHEFSESPDAPGPDTLYSYVRPGLVEPGLAIVVRRLGGRIPEQVPTPDLDTLQNDLPAEAQLRLSTCSWKTYSLFVVTAQYPAHETMMCSCSAVVPLCREAIQVMVVGPASRESQSRELLGTLLTSLKGLTYADALAQAGQDRLLGEG